MASAKAEDDRSICGTALTIDMVESVIKTTPSNSKIVKFEAEDFGTGKGFLSVMARINITWQPANPNLPTCVIAKIPTSSKIHLFMENMDNGEAMMEQMKKKLHTIHNCEVSAYDLFSKVVEPPIPLPKVYGVKKMIEGGETTQPAYIIMEDLGVKNGLLNFTLMELPSEKQINQVFTMLGSLHGWSLKTMPLIEKVVESFDIMEMIEEMLSASDQQMEKLMETLNVPEWQELLGQSLIDRVPSIRLPKQDYLEGRKMPEKYGCPPVLCHGDMHSNNVMFKKDDAGAPSGDLGAVYDWQATHVGGPMEDFFRIIQVGVLTTNHTRFEWRKAAVKIYYDSFEKAFGSQLEISFEKMHEYFEEWYLLNMRLMAPFIPMMMKMFSKESKLPGMTDELVTKMRSRIMNDTKLILETIMHLMEKDSLAKKLKEVKV